MRHTVGEDGQQVEETAPSGASEHAPQEQGEQAQPQETIAEEQRADCRVNLLAGQDGAREPVIATLASTEDQVFGVEPQPVVAAAVKRVVDLSADVREALNDP